MSTKILGPILLPDTPDCDYNNGEELLSNEQIQHLVTSYKDYNIVDYEHQFTNPDDDYYMKNIGKPLRVFISDKKVTFTDVSDTKLTVPRGTAWLEAVIDDPVVEKEIDNKYIVAFSVTVAEKEDARYFIDLYNTYNPISSMKSDEARQRHARITQKRTLIKDITNPELLTVSVVKFPCVYKAKFCKQSVEKVDMSPTSIKSDNMSEDYTEQNLFDELRDGLRKLRSNSSKADDTPADDKPEDAPADDKQEEQAQEDNKDYVTEDMLDKKLDDFKAEIIGEIVEAISTAKEPEQKDDGDKKEDEAAADGSSKKEDENLEHEEPIKKSEKDIQEPAAESEDTAADTTADTETPATTTEPAPATTKSSVGKAFSRKAEENKKRNKTAQPSRKTTLKHEGGIKSMKPIHERDIIQNAIKGDGTAIKTAIKENRKIIYSGKDYELQPYYQHKGVLSQLNKAGKHVFEESFSEEETNKAILSTELFARYVREMITPEAIFDAADYQTVYGEEAPIRRVKAAKSWTSQDGHLPANYYFDNIPEASELKHEKDVIRPVTQRDLFTISDRQLRNNVFGDDLLDVSLETIKGTFYNGVYAARILGDTDNEGQTYTPTGGSATDIDTQFTRKDGWVKQAGVQLSSDSDFDANKIVDVFDTMYYSLPEYAQEESNYAFFVPSQVRRAYYNHFIKNSRESKIDLVSEQRALYFNNIPILTSKTLSSAEFRNMLTGGDAKILLTNPDNTLLGVGRSFGIEPERHADTSSTYYYLTLDTDAKYVKPEEAVVATISADDYATLPVTTEPESP